jgi:hypothetical protein
MKTGWKEVARLGTEGVGYPHVLVDAHGWCLRLGRERGEERYYSNLPSLLQGLIEQMARARLRQCPVLMSASAMLAEVRAALAEAADHRKSLLALPPQEWPTRPVEGPKSEPSPPALFPPIEAA